jgi:hypothetical protein
MNLPFFLKRYRPWSSRSFAQSYPYGSKQFLGVKWFTNKKCGALCEGTSFDLVIMMSRDEDDRQFRALKSNAAL